MKVLGLGASPRRLGNTDILLDRVLDGARSKGASVEKVTLNDLLFRPCQECGSCDETGICVIRDDMQSLYKKIAEADVLILASPVFFTSLSAQAKAMIDRFQCAWVAKHKLKRPLPQGKEKKGLFLSVSASDKKEFFENAWQIVKTFFNTIGITRFAAVYYPGIEEKGGIATRDDALDKAYIIGKTLFKDI